MEEYTTIADECILLGAPRIVKKNGGYLANIIQRIVENYDSTEFNSVALLADIELAKENCDEITEAAQLVKNTLEKLHHELTESDYDTKRTSQGVSQ